MFVWIVLGWIVSIYLSFYFGKRYARRGFKRAVLRNRGIGSSDLTIQPSKEQGVMEMIFSSKQVKELKRGNVLRALLRGSKSSMVFLVRVA